jgi:hypothetical protein
MMFIVQILLFILVVNHLSRGLVISPLVGLSLINLTGLYYTGKIKGTGNKRCDTIIFCSLFIIGLAACGIYLLMPPTHTLLH